MQIKRILFVFFLTLVNSLASELFAQELFPARVEVVGVQIDGSGCDASSARAVFTNDLTTLSVLFDRYSVEIGKGTAQPKAKAAEKRCSVFVDIAVSPGWTYTLDSVEYRGFVELPNKSTFAYQLASIESSGLQAIGFDQDLVRGPKVDNHVQIVKVKSLALLNKKCGPSQQRLRIKSTIGVRNLLAAIGIMRPKVSIGIDSADGQINPRFKFNWQRCL